MIAQSKRLGTTSFTAGILGIVNSFFVRLFVVALLDLFEFLVNKFVPLNTLRYCSSPVQSSPVQRGDGEGSGSSFCWRFWVSVAYGQSRTPMGLMMELKFDGV